MLTIIRTADDKPLNKTFTRDKSGNISKQDYGNAYLYNAVVVDDIGSIRDLSDILTALESDPFACVIRGIPRDPARTQGVRRLLHDSPDCPARFKPNAGGVRWAMLDFDKAPVASLALTDDKARLGYLVSLLPAEFHHASFHYQWSASAGLNGWDFLSCHLWFWLSEPASDQFLRNRFDWGDWRDCEVDPSPFNAVQPHYTAAPNFHGMTDPLGTSRSGLVEGGSDEVVISPWIRPRPPVPSPEMSSLRQALYGERRHAPEHGGFLRLLGEIGPHYHRPILRAVAHYVATTSTEARDLGFLRDEVKQAIWLAPAGKSPKSDYLSDSYLNRVINGAMVKFGKGGF